MNSVKQRMIICNTFAMYVSQVKKSPKV